MPEPISSASRSNCETCDPSSASCADASATDAAPATATGASRPPVVTIAPVVITGDAGAQELLRRYDSDACSAQQQNAVLSCEAIGLGVLNTLRGDPLTGLATTLHASVACGKDLRSVYDCEQANEALAASRARVIEDCHAHDGVVQAGSSPNELVCEVAP